MAVKSKNADKELDETIRIMGRLAAMPHKPHVDKSVAKRKKGDGPTPRKSRRPKEA